jgi:hypothetical protein
MEGERGKGGESMRIIIVVEKGVTTKGFFEWSISHDEMDDPDKCLTAGMARNFRDCIDECRSSLGELVSKNVLSEKLLLLEEDE